MGSSVVLLLLCSAFCLAQEYRGRIEGIVTDQTKAVIPGATVTLLNIKTGIKTVRQTSDTGLYLFDLVDPGTYTVTVEAAGFSKFTQENIVVQTRGDVTVNASLATGTVQENVTVEATPVAVQFNTTNQDMTIDSTMAQETPRFDRNPFKLSLLAPEAINTRGEVLPFLSWSANSVDLGGGTNLKNDLQIDGSPVGMGHKFSYPPNMDAVQEVIVSQNSVDAEQGHSAGGVITMTTKAGTNEWHGDAFYLGRYPWLDAEADRTRFSLNAQRQHTIGGTLGNPIKKNKLFNFFSIEYWKVGSPGSYVTTVPTSLEQQGNFSQSYNINGGIRSVYDPFTTQVRPDGSVSRTPFPGNIVPASRFDPLSVSFMKNFWAPNNPGDNITGVNNFKKGYVDSWKYVNFADRVDYNINDKWKVYGRVGYYHTTDIAGNPTPNSSPLYQPTGSYRTATQVAGDAVWTINARTVAEFHGDYHNVADAYVSTPLGSNGWQQFWPNSNWFQPYFENSPGLPVYYPDLVIGGAGYGGRGFYWDQRPKGEAFSGKISQQRGSHYLKAGLEFRRSWGPVFVSNTSQFFFNTAVTADTFSNPNTALVGDQWATFLLGALDNQTEMVGGPVPVPITNFWGMFIQDDWKLNSRITLNLGLRNEYESAWHDAAHNLSQAMDLTAPVPEMQQNPPPMPALATQLVGGPNFYQWTGAWRFTTSGHPGMWDPPALALAPRIGAAIRIDDKTALRVGYARYVIPTEYNFTAAPVAGFEDINFLEPPFFGMTGYQFAAPLLNGVPQETISNPFPASNPLLPNFGPVNGKALGTNVGRGGENLLWYPQNFQKAYNDRININFQRQLPQGFVAGVTWFMNFGHQHYTKELNAINPSIYQQYANNSNFLNQTVANPFYHYLNTTLIPGPLYNQQQVPLSSLLVPYPQYGPLYEIGACCAGERYNQLQLKVQRAFANGFNFLFTYVYIRERSEINNFNDLTYYTNAFQWQDSNQPRHRLNILGTYELPIGKGRKYLASAPRALDALVGGWKITPVLQFISGDFPQFGNMLVTGNPCVSSPTPQAWFNTSVFKPIPTNTYVLRSNPLQYDCLTGPSFWDLDANLAKEFRLFERFRAELKMTAYNALNNLNRADPVTNIYSSTFGQALYQGSPGGTFGAQGGTAAYVSGRQVELSFKIFW
ncbi:MAG TPA: carboxypeptidase-like regulatory domain-containing protein [Bryobacteraceae bacterium]|nr:carboxypeptidase-like regulatory domain-containing protein [Bryobacteraceae bacterium]